MLEKKSKILSTYLDSLGITSVSSREHYLQRCWPVISRILDSKKKIKVIDAGSGHAYEAILFAALGADVIGIDLREDGHKVALKNVKKYESIFGRLSVVLINRDLFAAMEPLRADVIWSRQAISHIHPAERFVELARERLEPNGILVINDSNVLNPLVMVETAWEHWRDKGSFRYYVTNKYLDPVTKKPVPYAVERAMSSGGLKRMFVAAGFRQVHAEFTGYIPVSVASMMPRLALNCESSLKKIPLISKIAMEYTVVGKKAKSDGV